MPTIDKEASDLLARVYQLGDLGRLTLNPATDYSNKRTACYRLVKASRSMQRWAEKSCNGIERWDSKAKMMLASWTDADDAAEERARDKAKATAREAFAVLVDLSALEIEFQGDPRGAMIKLHPAGSLTNGGNPLLWV